MGQYFSLTVEIVNNHIHYWGTEHETTAAETTAETTSIRDNRH